ncbi:MAG TPA: hypothetical protein VNO50_15205 [Pyrinomonadaceae bacterium]|nr:hypothetical protein [Pyrinomonadaceae bacterium]
MSWSQFLQNLTIPLLTILVSGASAYFGAKRGKTAAFRQALHAKQMEACFELSILASRVCHVISALPNPPDKICASDLNELVLAYRKWAVCLPSDTHNATYELIAAAYIYLKTGREDSLTERKDLLFTYQRFTKELRKLVGTEPLSKETLRLMR